MLINYEIGKFFSSTYVSNNMICNSKQYSIKKENTSILMHKLTFGL